MNKPRILIVEDDPFSVQLLKHNLGNYGAEVLPAADSAEAALKIALEYKPDAALVDVFLSGGKTGVDAARAIKEHMDIPVIYLTGYSSDEIFEKAKDTDPFGYILKPYTPKELKVTLDMALYKHRISKELKASRLLLSTTLDALDEAVMTTDGSSQVLYANPVSQSMLNIKEGDRIDGRIKLAFPQTDEKVLFVPADFIGGSRQVYKLAGSKDEKYVRISVLDMTEGSAGFVIVFWDVTDEYKGYKNAEAVLGALESLDEGLLILHPQTEKILFASKGFERMTGWQTQEVLGESPQFLLGPNNNLSFWQKAKQTLSELGYAKAENVLFTKEGKAILCGWQISRMAPIKGQDEGQLIIFLRDVSAQRRMEEDFRQSQKIEAVGRLAGGVAHDFNNLLSIINSYSDLLTLKMPEGDPLIKYVENIRSAGQRAGELVSKLLTFSRRDTPKPMHLDVRHVTEEMRRMLRRVIREDIDIRVEYADKLGGLWADQLQVEQVLMNLCVNARDAIEKEGCIKIAWEMRALNENEAGRKKLVSGLYLVLSVSDNGSGIPPEVLEHIFEPYFTTKEEGRGTGLGLSIVQAVSKQLRGCIEVESQMGHGSTFRLYFPATQSPAKAQTVPPMVVRPSVGSESVLIVEDEESFADCLQSLLELHGYKVHHAKDAESAMKIFESSIYPISLLISDIVLPRISGQEMAKNMKAKQPDLKVIFITGYDNSRQILQEFPHAALVLQKPFSVVSMLNKIREVLDAPPGEKSST